MPPEHKLPESRIQKHHKTLKTVKQHRTGSVLLASVFGENDAANF